MKYIRDKKDPLCCIFLANMDLFQCCSSQWKEYLSNSPGLDSQENTRAAGKVTEELHLIRSFVMSPEC